MFRLLRETGRLDDALVIVTSDHGEVLGERGAWYKMSFYEGATRVPLIVRALALFPPARVPTAVSMMDLLDLADLEEMARFPPVERRPTAAVGED